MLTTRPPVLPSDSNRFSRYWFFGAVAPRIYFIIHRGTTFMYLQYSRPLIYHLLPNVWKAKYTTIASIFVHVRTDCSTAGTSSSLVLYRVPRSGFFHFGQYVEIAWTQVIQNLIILHDKARCHTAADVTDLLRCWQGEILEHPPYSPDMSPCDYYLFAKVKEPLRETRHNTRDELIRTIGRSIRNSTKMDVLMVYDAFQTFGKK